MPIYSFKGQSFDIWELMGWGLAGITRGEWALSDIGWDSRN